MGNRQFNICKDHQPAAVPHALYRKIPEASIHNKQPQLKNDDAEQTDE